MRKAIVAMLLAWLWVFVPMARAGLPETPRPRQLTVADGLPSDRINAIAQDRHGYLWVATSDGLARFDGVGFRVWRTEQGLRDNYVWAVHVDRQDRVWVGTRSAGLAVLDARRETFTWMDKRMAGIGCDEVWGFAGTADGSLWIGTATGGLSRWRDGRVDRFMPVEGDPRSLPHAGIRKMLVGHDGSLWVGTAAGVARWSGRDFERLEGLPSPLVNGLGMAPDGTLWVGTPAGVTGRAADGRRVAPGWRSRGGDLLQVLLQDRERTHWFDIPQGLAIEGDGEAVVVPLYSSASRGLVRPSWVEAREDHEGGLWFASNSSGLWYLPPHWRQFSVLSRRLDDPASLANAQVRGIAPAADGSIWLVGSGGVLDRFDSETGAVEHRVADIGEGMILDAVLEDRAGMVWVTYGDGLARIDPRTRAIRRWRFGEAGGPMQGETASIVQEADGLLWFGGEFGVQVRDAAGALRRHFTGGDGRGLPRGVVLHGVVRDPHGRVWISTSAGLFVPDAAGARLQPVAGVAPGPVFDVAFGDAGVWLARNAAVEHYAGGPKGLVLKRRFGAETGFPQLAPTGLVVDRDGVVWVTSVRGLIRVDPVARRSRVYGVRDGLPSQEFFNPPVARPGDGRILAGTPDGLVVFDPAVVRPEARPPRLVVQTVDVTRGASRLPLDPARGIEIAHDDRDLRVRARLMSFSDATAHEYRFRLSGFDRGWVPAGPGGERTFSQLPPGDYRLQVSARTADRVWSPPVTLAFRVMPPWWRTWWAITLGVLALIGLLVAAALAYRHRLARRLALQQAEREREMALEASVAKSRFLATFGHEVRTPMTGVLGMSELLLDTPLDTRQRGFVTSIRSAGEHLLRLLNDALDLSRIESGRLELSTEVFDLHALLDDVAALIGPLAQRRGLDFRLERDDVPRYVSGDPSRLRQILLNLLGNAIKFTEQGRVALQVGMRGEWLRFVVADTGPGLSDEQQSRLFRRFEQAEGARTSARYGGSGLGLAISQELAQAMGGDIDVESAPGQGARFIVDLPLPAVAAPEAAPAVPQVRIASMSLLLVEDDPTVADVICGLLRAQGHRVHHAPHGLAALAEAELGAFDAALLDLDLPGIDGFALARQLRARGFAIPLLAVTARSDAETEPRALAAGFDLFLRKPVSGAMLAEALENASSLHEAPAPA